MTVNLDVALKLLETFGPALIGVVVGLVLYLVCWPRKPKQPPIQKPKSPDVQFLEAALDDDPPPNPDYSYDDFQRDLRDKRLTFNEIYEKCGGQIPQRPKESENATESETALEDDKRRKKMQAWFEKMPKSGILKVVNPPMLPQPIAAITGQPVGCSSCHGSGSSYGSSSFGSIGLGGNYRSPVKVRGDDGKCRSCNGTGFVIISKG